jgi:hypothetical protein
MHASTSVSFTLLMARAFASWSLTRTTRTRPPTFVEASSRAAVKSPSPASPASALPLPLIAMALSPVNSVILSPAQVDSHYNTPPTQYVKIFFDLLPLMQKSASKAEIKQGVWR